MNRLGWDCLLGSPVGFEGFQRWSRKDARSNSRRLSIPAVVVMTGSRWVQRFGEMIDRIGKVSLLTSSALMP